MAARRPSRSLLKNNCLFQPFSDLFPTCSILFLCSPLRESNDSIDALMFGGVFVSHWVAVGEIFRFGVERPPIFDLIPTIKNAVKAPDTPDTQLNHKSISGKFPNIMENSS